MLKQITWVMLCCYPVFVSSQNVSNRNTGSPDSIATHKVILDDQSKIISWIRPQSMAYDRFLRDRWNFIIRGVPNSPGPAPRSNYPQYYFYCAYKDQQMIPDTWMNDVGEKVPNWFESARLYYQYTGDRRVMDMVVKLISYTLAHGTSPASFAWPDFPYTTTNAGDTIFQGFTNSKKLVLHEVQVDHAGDIGFTYYKLYLYTGDVKFKTAAIQVANAIANHAPTGSATRSVLPYRVVMSDGRVTAEYGANWMGSYSLLDILVQAKLGNVKGYQEAMKKIHDFMILFPMKTGCWTDGHTDTDVNSNTYKSNMSASNMVLYMLDHPAFDPEYKTDIPKLIRWTDTNFVMHSAPGEPSYQWGASIVGEQDGFLPKMDYQTARYGAETARWYAISGDSMYREKAYRSLNWVTYCSDSSGLAFESPLSNGVTSWWSDCYGEGPRMFYHALAAISEWAPPGENHILYSTTILKEVVYTQHSIRYQAPVPEGLEYFRISFQPKKIKVNGVPVKNYQMRSLGQGDYAITLKRTDAGPVSIE